MLESPYLNLNSDLSENNIYRLHSQLLTGSASYHVYVLTFNEYGAHIYSSILYICLQRGTIIAPCLCRGMFVYSYIYAKYFF